MARTPIRLLIADDNLEICDILEHFFELTDEVEVCGVAHDGEEALYRIAQNQPDLVLLDLIMPKTDGLSVLERLAHAELPVKPKVVVASAVGQESFTRAALERGADYYMIKPYDLTDLLSRICLVADTEEAAATTPQRMTDPLSVTTREVMEMGLPLHMRGYQYIIAAVQLLLRENRPCSIVKEVYSGVAEEYATTPQCVEGAIRKALRRAWDDGNLPLRELMGVEIGLGAPPPANGRFLVALTQRIRLELAGEGKAEEFQ